MPSRRSSGLSHAEIKLLKELVEALDEAVNVGCTCDDDSTTCYYTSDLYPKIQRAKDLLERLELAE